MLLKVPGSDEEEKLDGPWVMSEGEDVTPELLNTGRYKVTGSMVDKAFNYTLTITGLCQSLQAHLELSKFYPHRLEHVRI